MHLLLDVTPYIVIDQIKVGAIQRPQTWRNDSRCSQKIAQCRMPSVQVCCLVERLRNCLTHRASRATADVIGACRNNIPADLHRRQG